MSILTPPSRLAIAALALGVLTALVMIVGVISASFEEGEAVFAPLFFTAVPTAIVGLAGVVVSIVALARRARPRWFGAVGLVLSAIPLTIAVVVLIQFMLLFAWMNTHTYAF